MDIKTSSQCIKLIKLDSNFSTTRLVMLDKPAIVNDPSSKIQSFLFSPPTPESKGEGGLRTQKYFKHSYNDSSALSTYLSLPLVTVITIVFEGEAYLEQTILSVINQTYENVEYIIIDGGSTDKTLEIIKKYNDVIDYWISEPDKGIADAMNKGISLSTGILINHLHAGDKFHSNETISEVVKSYLLEKWRWCFGNQFLKNSSDETVGYFCPPKFSKRFLHLVNTIPHQTVFSEKSLIQEVGLFDRKYKCAMDYHLWLRYTQVSQPKQFNFAIAEFLLGGYSSNIKSALKEEFQARVEVLKQSPVEKFISLIVVLIRYIKSKLNIRTFVKKR
jgi:glycosyltransferase involved in cell wall biosynthesis